MNDDEKGHLILGVILGMSITVIMAAFIWIGAETQCEKMNNVYDCTPSQTLFVPKEIK